MLVHVATNLVINGFVAFGRLRVGTGKTGCDRKHGGKVRRTYRPDPLAAPFVLLCDVIEQKSERVFVFAARNNAKVVPPKEDARFHSVYMNPRHAEKKNLAFRIVVYHLEVRNVRIADYEIAAAKRVEFTVYRVRPRTFFQKSEFGKFVCVCRTHCARRGTIRSAADETRLFQKDIFSVRAGKLHGQPL